MIGIIPNPKKSFQIDKPIFEVNQSIKDLPYFTKDYTFTKSNESLNIFTYEASEFLSLGVYIDINCMSVNETKTQVEIEIRRKVGSFNKSHEVSLANQHLTKLIDLISTSIACDKIKLDNLKEQERRVIEANNEKIKEQNRKLEEEKTNNPGWFYLKVFFRVTLFFAVVIGFIYIIYMMFWNK